MRRTTTAAKTSTLRKKKVFLQAKPEQHFRLVSGEELGHFVDLADKLATLQDEIFAHHVTDDRHDFATWIHDVFGDEELAVKLSTLRNKQDVRVAIYEHLVHKYLY